MSEDSKNVANTGLSPAVPPGRRAKTYEGLTIHCADIGSVKQENFGWARLAGNEYLTDNCMDALVNDVASAVSKERKVALGFECPLWVPVASEPQDLTKGRQVDENRPWSAGAGAVTLAIGTSQVAWILDELRFRLEEQGTPLPSVLLSLPDFLDRESGLFLWEAFVTGKAKAVEPDHGEDALIACREFRRRLQDPVEAREPERRVRSLIGGAILWAGLSDDLDLLHKSCFVVRPDAAR